ncbi:MAG TPA: TraR/DksA C4-type zinc finger protein [Candidatus Paceibacterota bacterium]|nr:TraR/DksA C4-type zinc finger protein [Candidatus Paceibacterota bacterium]
MHQKYKTQLESLLSTLTEELKTVGIQDTKNIHDWIARADTTESGDADPNVSADALEDLEEKQSLITTLESDYNDIVRALEKIEQGTFGVCEVCDAPIEEGRLDAVPTARTCVAHRENSLE